MTEKHEGALGRDLQFIPAVSVSNWIFVFVRFQLTSLEI